MRPVTTYTIHSARMSLCRVSATAWLPKQRLQGSMQVWQRASLTSQITARTFQIFTFFHRNMWK